MSARRCRLQRRTARRRGVELLLLVPFLVAWALPAPLAAQNARVTPALEAGRGFALEPNTPNPADPDTWIPFQLEPSLFSGTDPVIISLRIYNVLRQVVGVAVLVPEHGPRIALVGYPVAEPGRLLAYWNGRDAAGKRVPSGVYYAELVVGAERQIGKMIVLNEPRRRPRIPWLGGKSDPP